MKEKKKLQLWTESNGVRSSPNATLKVKKCCRGKRVVEKNKERNLHGSLMDAATEASGKPRRRWEGDCAHQATASFDVPCPCHQQILIFAKKDWYLSERSGNDDAVTTHSRGAVCCQASVCYRGTSTHHTVTLEDILPHPVSELTAVSARLNHLTPSSRPKKCQRPSSRDSWHLYPTPAAPMHS